MKYSAEKIDAIAAKLRDMPIIEKKKPDFSKQEAVKALSKEIVAMQKRGYTLDQVSAALRGEGLAVATPTLKSYLQRAKPKKLVSPTASESPAPLAAVTVSQDSAKAKFAPKSDSRDI